MNMHRAYHVGCPRPAECEVDRRALALWPGLDRRALARCRHEVSCIVALVERRSGLPPSAIRVLLAAPSDGHEGHLLTREEVATWFG